MSIVSFEALPEAARAWIFAADRPVTGDDARRLLHEVDVFLADWRSHGADLRCARDWRDDRFLVVGVDEGRDGGGGGEAAPPAAASGCSIDGMYRVLRALEGAIGSSMMGGGRVFYRDCSGQVVAASRAQFAQRAREGVIDGATPAFDTGLTTVGDVRARFEGPVSGSWHSRLLPAESRIAAGERV